MNEPEQAVTAFRSWISRFKTKCLTGEAASMAIMDAALYEHYRHWWDRFANDRIVTQGNQDFAAHGFQAGVEWERKRVMEEAKKN